MIERSCKICGGLFDASRRGGPRYCGAECRRAGYALHAQNYRAREALADPDFATARAAYNRERLARSPVARAAKQLSDRRHRQNRRDDAEWIAAKRQRWADYYERVGSDPQYREQQRRRISETRRQDELRRIQEDIAALGRQEGKHNDD